MKTRRLLLLLCILCSAYVSAQTELALQVVLTNGQTTLYRLSEQPVMKMDSANVTIETTQTTFTYSDAEVKEYTFIEAVPTAIEAAENDADMVVRVDGDKLTISGAQAGQAFSVYSIGGMLVSSGKTEDGCTTLNLHTLPQGAYIVKVNGSQTLKFIKR